MPFQILNVLLVSLGCVIPLILLTFVWAFHWLPYPRKGQNIKQRLDEMRKAGFKKLVTDFPYYERESHMRGDHNAHIAKGLLLSSIIYIGGVGASALVLFLITIILGKTPNYFYIIYSVLFFLFSAFIFPDQFIKYAKLTGRWTEFFIQGDAPTTPAFWGAFASIYTSMIIIKTSSTLDLKFILDFFPTTVGTISVIGIPFILLVFIAGMTKGSLPKIKFQNWIFFMVSWLIGFVDCLVLAFILLLG